MFSKFSRRISRVFGPDQNGSSAISLSSSVEIEKTYEIHHILQNVSGYKKDVKAELTVLFYFYNTSTLFDSYELTELLEQLFIHFSSKFIYFFTLLVYEKGDIARINIIKNILKQDCPGRVKAVQEGIYDNETERLIGIKAGANNLFKIVAYYCQTYPELYHFIYHNQTGVTELFDELIYRELTIAALRSWDWDTAIQWKKNFKFYEEDKNQSKIKSKLQTKELDWADYSYVSNQEIQRMFAIMPFQYEYYIRKDPTLKGQLAVSDELISKKEMSLRKVNTLIMSQGQALRYKLMIDALEGSRIKQRWAVLHKANSVLLEGAIEKWLANENPSSEQVESLKKRYFQVNYQLLANTVTRNEGEWDPCNPQLYQLLNYPEEIVSCLSKEDKIKFENNLLDMERQFKIKLANDAVSAQRTNVEADLPDQIELGSRNMLSLKKVIQDLQSDTLSLESLTRVIFTTLKANETQYEKICPASEVSLICEDFSTFIYMEQQMSEELSSILRSFSNQEISMSNSNLVDTLIQFFNEQAQRLSPSSSMQFSGGSSSSCSSSAVMYRKIS